MISTFKRYHCSNLRISLIVNIYFPLTQIDTPSKKIKQPYKLDVHFIHFFQHCIPCTGDHLAICNVHIPIFVEYIFNFQFQNLK